MRHTRKPLLFLLGWMLALFVPFSSSLGTAHAQPANCLPSQVLLVVDHSGSMQGSKWSNARTAFNQLLNKFGNKLQFGLITFSSSANLRVQLGPNTANQIKQTLNALNPTGSTAMKCALQESFRHYQGYAIPNDPVKDRRRFVVIITDGTPNTCGTDVIPAVSSLRRIPVQGRNYDVKTFVIGFGSGVDTRQLQGMAQAGGTGKYYQANNLSSLQQALNQIGNGAAKEICDNKDNDCDGKVDGIIETCSGPCGQGKRTCNSGVWTNCSAARTPTKEVCNNIDDDCNGSVDDGLKRDCSNKCGTGQEFCKAGKWEGCNAPAAKTEVCNGKDDNCNGRIDENVTRPCTTKCGKGTQACIQADWSTCSAAQHSIEVCDGLDNDCDGQIDNNVPKDKCSGQCVKGECQPKCNQGECLGGQMCVNKYCVPRPCSPTCTNGEVCRSGSCVPSDCTQAGGECPQSELCINKKCVKDPCKGVQCGKDQFCRRGQCIHSCATVRCGTGEVCKAGLCQKAPCNGGCTKGSSCIQGTCMPDSCSQCAKGQVCKGSQCVEDLCQGVQCGSNQYCKEGDCYDKNGPGPGPGPGTEQNPGTPDGGTVGPKPDGGTVGPKPDSTTGGPSTTDKDPGTGGPRTRGGTCVCSSTPLSQHIPLSLLLFILCVPFFIRRTRHKK